jgi:ribonuclease HI
MATLPTEHPLRKTIYKAAARGYVKSHPSPIHELLHTYNINPKRLETISAIRDTNRYRLQAKVYITSSKERAIETEHRDTSDIKIFTDGSATNGKVGAATIIYRNGRKVKTIWKHLGTDKEHTVYEAECAAILMGIHAIRRWRYNTATVYTDNQAALQGLSQDTPGPGKYILDAVHNGLKAAKEKNKESRIRLRWIPGHKGVEGNEEADKGAKEAAEGRTSKKKDLPKMLQKDMPASKSAEKQNFYNKIKKASTRRWKQYVVNKYMSKTAPDFPTKKHCETLGKLTRREASIWTQLKTGHIGLNKHLNRINVKDSPKCPKCKCFNETVEHFLLHCKAYTQERKRLRRAVGRSGKEIGKLLSNHKNARAVVEYVKETGRLRWTKEEKWETNTRKETRNANKERRAGQTNGETSANGERRAREREEENTGEGNQRT